MMIRLASEGGCHAANIPAFTAAQQGTPKSADADSAVSIPSAIPSVFPADARRIAAPLATVPAIKRRGSVTGALRPSAVRYVRCNVEGVPSGPVTIAIIAG